MPHIGIRGSNGRLNGGDEAAAEAPVPTVQVFDRQHYPALSPADAQPILAVIAGSGAA
jgi:hypothetical protein